MVMLGVVLAMVSPLGAMSAAQAGVRTPGVFTSLAPSRLLDTRIGVGAPKALVAAGGTVHLQVAGRGGVPASGVSAVALNVTVTAPAKPGHLSVFADGTSRPGTSNLNFVNAQTVAKLTAVTARAVVIGRPSTGPPS